MKTPILSTVIAILTLAAGTGISAGETEVSVSIGLRRQSPENLNHHHDHRSFHDALTPYGYWIEYPNLGKVWQPAASATDRNWRPYCNEGHWVWTDRGWYWESNYAWGWACFHYGRWLHTEHHNWVWVPGDVWAPAWVHWRSGHNHTYGWAPLPPHCGYTAGIGFHYPDSRISFNFGVELCDDWYVFVSHDNFFSLDIGGVVFGRSRCSTYYRSSSCYDHGYRMSGGVIFHAGPSAKLSFHAGTRSSTINRIVGKELKRSPKHEYRPGPDKHHPQEIPYKPAPHTYKRPPEPGPGAPPHTYRPPPSYPSWTPGQPYRKPPSKPSREPSGTYRKPPASSGSSGRTYKRPPSNSGASAGRTYRKPPSGSRSTPSKRSPSRSDKDEGKSRSERIKDLIKSRR